MDLVTPKTPQEILPLEVWDLIFSHLRSPSHLSNCHKVCKAWRKLLERKKTTFLMPKVLPILYKYMQIVKEDEEEETENQEEKESTKTTILKMRLVSHGWKESVDNYQQNLHELHEVSFEVITEEEYDEYFIPYPLIFYNFGFGAISEPITKQESFLERGFSPDSNPFLTRCVSYFEFDDNERHQLRFKTAFKRILEAFGSQIWKFDLSFRNPTNKADVYKLVDSYLRLMPNLRSLCLSFYGGDDNGNPKNTSEKELEMLFKREPLPRLEHLTQLGMRSVPYPLSVGILTSNGHLQKVAFQNSDFDDDKLPDYIANVKLPTLMQLEFPCNENRLLSFPKISWPITVLYLNVEAAKLENVIKVVSSNFSDTLEHLAVRYNTMVKCNKQLKQTRLDLPKLRKFQLDIIPNTVETIDFLQGCTALQEIKLAFYVSHKDKKADKDSSSRSSMDEDDSEVIQFKDCITSMNQSNIWQILDKLQCIKFKINGIKNDVSFKEYLGHPGYSATHLILVPASQIRRNSAQTLNKIQFKECITFMEDFNNWQLLLLLKLLNIKYMRSQSIRFEIGKITTS